jgi:hypothetical protein
MAYSTTKRNNILMLKFSIHNLYVLFNLLKVVDVVHHHSYTGVTKTLTDNIFNILAQDDDEIILILNSLVGSKENQMREFSLNDMLRIWRCLDNQCE